MSRYNRFGMVHGDVTALYPGTALADYDAGGAAGQTKIEGAIDRAVFEVTAALPPAVFKAMTNVEAQEVIDYATANLAAFTLGMVPVVAGSVHLWLYPLAPPLGGVWTSLNGVVNDAWYKPPVKGFLGVAAADYAVTASTGAISYTGRAINAGERVFASYSVDVDNAAFSSPMLGQVAVLGAAAELGERLYSASTQEWALVTQYRTRYNDLIKQLKDGSLIPDEIRKLKYFTEIERVNNEVRSVRFLRG